MSTDNTKKTKKMMITAESMFILIITKLLKTFQS